MIPTDWKYRYPGGPWNYVSQASRPAVVEGVECVALYAQSPVYTEYINTNAHLEARLAEVREQLAAAQARFDAAVFYVRDHCGEHHAEAVQSIEWEKPR